MRDDSESSRAIGVFSLVCTCRYTPSFTPVAHLTVDPNPTTPWDSYQQRQHGLEKRRQPILGDLHTPTLHSASYSHATLILGTQYRMG